MPSGKLNKIWALITFVLIFRSVSFCLAPHPLYFTVDGSPTKIEVNVDGEDYHVVWDGTALALHKESDCPDKNDQNKGENEDPDNPEPPKLFALGCLIGCSLIFWGVFIGYWLFKWGILFEASIIGLIGILIIHIFKTLKKQ